MRSLRRKILVGVLIFSCLTSPSKSFASGGSLDPNFGNGGYLVVDDVESSGSTYEVINDVGSQGTKLILVGERAGTLYVARTNVGGQLDLNFGGQNTGFITLNGYSQADKVAVLSNGSFFVLGSLNVGGQTTSALLKFTSDGLIDPSFSEVNIDYNFDNDYNNFYPRDLILSPTQDSVYTLLRAYIAGGIDPPAALIYKFNLSGTQDTDFLANYKTAMPYGSIDANSLAVFGNFVYVAGYKYVTENYNQFSIGQIIKYNSDGTRDNNFPSVNTNYRPNFVSENPNYIPGQFYDVQLTDIKATSSGDLYAVGIAYAPYFNGTYEESEFFIKKISNTGSEELSSVIFREDFSSNGILPSIDLYPDNKVIITAPYYNVTNSSIFTRILRFNSNLTADSFGANNAVDLLDSYTLKTLLLHANQRIVSAGGYGDLAANGYVVSQLLSFDRPTAPTVTLATATGSTSATVSFNTPISNGGAAITGYTATSSPGGFMGTLAGATGGTITVTGLSAETSYTFTVTATNSEGTSNPSALSNSITTQVSGGGGTGGGGTGGGGTGGGGTTTSTTAADELKRQQDAAAAAAQKQAQELKEILSLVPTIAGLAQGIAGLGNSLLLPKTCVKGKTVKKVKAGSKCPAGYKAKK